MDVEAMYQEIILDHYRNPQGRGLREPFDAEVHHVNPTCGDELTLRVRLSPGHDRIEDVSFEGQGCSISQASASILYEHVSGASIGSALRSESSFRALMHGRGEPPSEDDADQLGDAVAFTGVAKYPARIKCALLAWMALMDALGRAGIEPGDHEAGSDEAGAIREAAE